MNEENFEFIIEGIVQDGYAVCDNFLSKYEVSKLHESLTNRYNSGLFKEARIGKHSEVQLDKEIRGDEIFWLESETKIASEISLLNLNHDFIKYLNDTCFLGIINSEIHYAKYSIGKYYKRHLDSFQSQAGRILSVIYYLNENWDTKDGGELIIYINKNGIEERICIEPIGGRFVCFQSDKLEHEVLETFKERNSITGWLVK